MTKRVPLTKEDRCDSCGAEARFMVELQAGDLLFCGHHKTKHETALADQGAEIYQKWEAA